MWNFPRIPTPFGKFHIEGAATFKEVQRRVLDQATYVKCHAPCKHAVLPEAGLSAYVLSVVLSTTYSVFRPFGVTVK